MSDKERIIAKQRLIVCPRCQTASRVPVTITEGMLPVKLTCPRCGTVTVTLEDKIPELPKVEPPKQEQWWVVAATELLEAMDDEPDPPQVEGSTPEPVARMATFHSRAEEISGALIKGLELVYTLQQDISAFEHSFYQHFTESTRIADFFLDSWNPYFLREFLLYPFSVLPITCEEELASKYARLLVAPKFIKPRVGISLPCFGGFNVELVNQYSLLSKPIVSAAFREYLNIPPSLTLELVGNKLIGSSLDHCWRDIPGLLEDGGHTTDSPSVIIHPQHSVDCRMWLARHGVQPWSPREIPHRLIRNEEEAVFDGDDKLRQAYREAWQMLARTGRVAIYWLDIMNARDFAVKAGRCIKGPKVVILSREQDQAPWVACGASASEHSSGRFLFYGPDDQRHLTLEKIQDIRLVIVDHLYAVNLQLLKMLYDYEGALLILCADPVLDFSESNVSANLLHGLVCSSVYDEDQAVLREEGVDWTKAIHWDSAPLRALLRLRGQPCSQHGAEPPPEFDIDLTVPVDNQLEKAEKGAAELRS